MLFTKVTKPLLAMIHRRCIDLGIRNLKCKFNSTIAATKVKRNVNPNYNFDIENLKYPAIVSSSESVFATASSSLDPGNNAHVVPGYATKKMFQELSKHVTWEDTQGFLDTLPTVINDIIRTQPQFQTQYSSSSGLADRFRRIVTYNSTPFTQFGAMQTLAVNSFYNNSNGFIPQSLYDADNAYIASSQLTNNELAYRLGWCSELMILNFFIHDDLVDGSRARYGQNCWHLTPENFPQSTRGQEDGHNTQASASAASYDVLLLQNTAHALLKIYFGAYKCGPALEDLFLYVMHSNIGGMAIEVEENAKFFNSGRLCSMEAYLNFRSLQNGLILSYFPIAAAAILHGVANTKILKELESACSDIFLYFAITRDYVDCYTDVNYMGNDGTDIQNGRITWLLITAMERASPLQQTIIMENVGKSSKESVERVLEIYAELKLPRLLKNWQIQFYEITANKIRNLSPELPRDYLMSNLDIFNKHLSH